MTGKIYWHNQFKPENHSGFNSHKWSNSARKQLTLGDFLKTNIIGCIFKQINESCQPAMYVNSIPDQI